MRIEISMFKRIKNPRVESL